MNNLTFEQIDFLSPQISNAISTCVNDILKPFVETTHYDDFDIDLLIDSARDKIAELFTEHAISFVGIMQDKGVATANTETKKLLKIP